jgi:hypothetical protein
MTTIAIPSFRAFAFLDVEHPVVAWEVYRGALVSALARDEPPEAPVSMMFAGIIQEQNNIRFRNEILIEAIRAMRHPDQVSRLTGLYCFENEQSASKAYSWGRHFKQENLAEIEVFPVGRVTRVDADWITSAPLDNEGQIAGNDLAWVDQYWRGEPWSNSPAWEVIFQGRAVVTDTALRERAYRVCQQEFPDALDMLEVARICAAVGFDVGRTIAWITQIEPGLLQLAYFMDMRDAENPELLQRIGRYQGPRNMRDLQSEKTTFGVGDLRRYFRTFKASFEFDDKGALRTGSVHLIK